MWIATIVAIVTFFLAVGVFFWRWRKTGADTARAWLDSFLSVLFAASLAFSVGLILYFMQRESEDNAQREVYRQMLSNEISYAIVSIEERTNFVLVLGPDTLSVPIQYLPSVVLEDAGKSGLFTREHSWSMLATAAMIREHNLLTNMFVSALTALQSGSIEVQPLRIAARRLNEASTNVQQGGNYILNHLQLGVSTMAFETFGKLPDSTSAPSIDNPEPKNVDQEIGESGMSVYEILSLVLASCGLIGLFFYVWKTWKIASATKEHNAIITRPYVTVMLVSDKERPWELDHIYPFVQNHTSIHAKVMILLEYEVKRVQDSITTKITTPIVTGNYNGKEVWNIAAKDKFIGHTVLGELEGRKLELNEEAILNITVQVSPFDKSDFRSSPPRQYRWKCDPGEWVPYPVPES